MRDVVLIFLLLLGLAGLGQGATIRVPDDYTRIGSAISAAQSGDTVLVAPGTYTGLGNRDIQLFGKDIILRSESGPEVTIIDAQGTESENHRVFLINMHETEACRVEGFTITGGYSLDLGNSNGGGVRVYNSASTFVNCRFIGNEAENGGGACVHSFTNPVFTGCIFTENAADSGGAMDANFGGQPRLENCNLLGNYGRHAGSAVRLGSDAQGTELVQCVVAFNFLTPPIEGLEPILTCCDIYGNDQGDWVGVIEAQTDQNGNFSAHPRFCGWRLGNYSLEPASPCAPANSECGLLVGAFDVGCQPGYRTWSIDPTGNGDAPTIQAAVDQAVSGDTILLAPGTYTGDGNRDIDFRGKQLVLR
jgi:hypothetical protein